MPRYEYKVVPAPTKGLKAKGVRSAEDKFANAIQELMNGLAGNGWEYQRAETLPSVERSGLTGTATEWRNMLVFRRPRESDAEAFQPELLPAPVPVEPEPEAPVAAQKAEVRAEPRLKAQDDPGAAAVENTAAVADNGIDEPGNAEEVGSSLQASTPTQKSNKSDA